MFNHELLTLLINENPNLALGTDNVNLPRVIRILAKVYETKLSNETINNSIKSIFDNIKKSSNLQNFVAIAKEGADEKIAKKINKLLA